MRYLFTVLAGLCTVPAFAADFPKFKMQQIDSGLKIGYAVVVTDIDGDKKPDIVVVDQHKVGWYGIPASKAERGRSTSCSTARRGRTTSASRPSTSMATGCRSSFSAPRGSRSTHHTRRKLVWLKRGKDVTNEWTMHELPCDEPMVHRVRVFDIDGDGKPEIVHVPLIGRDATRANNWMDGRGVRIVALKVPATNPEKKENWKTQVLSDELHVCHNFWPSSEIFRPRVEGRRSTRKSSWPVTRGSPPSPVRKTHGNRRRSGMAIKRISRAIAGRARSRMVR